MLIDITHAIGLFAAIATLTQVAFGQGGQLLRLTRCSAIEVQGIHCGAFALNTLSHCLWGIFGLGIQSLIIILPNLLGAALSALIVWRVGAIRRFDAKSYGA